MTQMYGDVEAKQREEAIAKSKGITTPYEAGYTQAGDIASRQATQQMASQTEFEKEFINNKNALDRLDIQYRRDLEAAKARSSDERQLREIENNYALERDKINKKSQFDLERFRQSAPPEEQKNLNAYLARWKKNPANKDKPETDGVSQFYSDRLGGQFKENKTDVTGTNQLLVSLQNQLENDLQLTPAQKNEIRKKIAEQQGKLEAAINRGLGGLPTGSTQLPPGFVPDQPGR